MIALSSWAFLPLRRSVGEPVIFIRRAQVHDPIAAAAEMIITKGIGCLPVVDGTTLVGMITKTDLLRCLTAQDAA